jgi:hypothetical protein
MPGSGKKKKKKKKRSFRPGTRAEPPPVPQGRVKWQFPCCSPMICCEPCNCSTCGGAVGSYHTWLAG